MKLKIGFQSTKWARKTNRDKTAKLSVCHLRYMLTRLINQLLQRKQSGFFFKITLARVSRDQSEVVVLRSSSNEEMSSSWAEPAVMAASIPHCQASSFSCINLWSQTHTPPPPTNVNVLNVQEARNDLRIFYVCKPWQSMTVYKTTHTQAPLGKKNWNILLKI